MKTLLLIISSLLLFPVVSIKAQSNEKVDHLDINNVKISLSSFGDFARKRLNYQSEMPKGKNTFCGFEQGMWINAITQTGEKLESLNPIPFHRSNKKSFYRGPITDNPDSDFYNKYNRVWKINKSEIDYHIENYSNIDYIIPSDIKEWPAHGDSDNGEAKNLAPFVDQNQNGIYEPELGDYPDIRGDQALFTIINDKNGSINKPAISKLNLEIHIMLYAYSRFDYSFAQNTYFLHYEIHNRSKNNHLNELNIAQISIMELGYGNDDYIGTDVNANMVFTYNGDNNDEYHYGENPPAFGLKLLNNPVYSTYNLNYHQGVDGFPSTEQERRYALEGKYNNGSQQTYYQTMTDFDESKFAFPGTTDPNIERNITEEARGNSPRHTNNIITTRFHDVPPGGKICLDYAGIFARKSGLNNFEQVDYLRDQASGVQNLYNAANTTCTHQLSVQESELDNNFSSYISHNTLFIQCQDVQSKNQNIELINILGQSVYSDKFSTGQNVHAINLQGIKPGPYFVRIQNETLKVIIP